MSAYGSLKQSLNLTRKPRKCPQLPTEIVHLWECKNTEFLWKLKCRTVHLQGCLLRELPLVYYHSSEFTCPSLLSLCHSLVSRHPSLCVVCFHYSLCMCFSIFILSLCMPLNHIFLLLVSCRHHFHSTACTCKPLLSVYHSGSLASFLLFFPGFVVSINIFLWLILPSLFLTLFPFYNFVLIVIFHSSLICPFFSRPICYHLYHLFTLS